MTRTPSEILRSLVADIEAMNCKMPREHDDQPDVSPDAYFGPFGTFVAYTPAENNECGAVVEWPNLRILLDEAKAALYFETKTGEPT
jgi:hypothetical protein